MRRILPVFASFIFLLGAAQPALAQAMVTLTNVGAKYVFGQEVDFSANIKAGPIQAAYLLFQVQDDAVTRTYPITIDKDGNAVYKYAVPSGVLPPFSRIFFWYHLALAGGGAYDSPHYYFQYDDNRYPWQTVDGYGLRLHWYAGDISFGQAALDAAHAGYQSIQGLIPVQAGSPISIYVYASAADVQDALQLGGKTLVGGQASPDLGVVLVSIAPGDTQTLEMQRQIPHELAHVMLYRMTQSGYTRLPAWLSEGFASQVEGYPNSDYAQVLAGSTQNNGLIPIQELCGTFPADASGAILAYAESESFVRYLHETYGTASLQELIRAYADGLTCDQGANRAYGLPLARLDAQWQQTTLGVQMAGLAFQNLLPYILLLGIILLIPLWALLAKKPVNRTGGNVPGGKV